jgi:hypothetical protein
VEEKEGCSSHGLMHLQTTRPLKKASREKQMHEKKQERRKCFLAFASKPYLSTKKPIFLSTQFPKNDRIE